MSVIADVELCKDCKCRLLSECLGEMIVAWTELFPYEAGRPVADMHLGWLGEQLRRLGELTSHSK
jgi:hypothetical protein